MTPPTLFPISVLGPVSVRYPAARARGRLPSPGDQYVLAALVAAGADGITLAQLDSVRPSTGTFDPRALRMALSRLRQHLPDDAVPDATDGRYRLVRPVTEVDAWRLAALADDGAPGCTDAELRHLMRPVEPFQGLRSSDLLDDAIARIRADQRRLLVRLDSERPDVLRGPLLEHLEAHVELDPYDEALLAVVVESMSAAGKRREALALMASARREFHEAGLTMGRGLDGLEHALLEGDRVGAPAARAGRRRAAAALAQHLDRTFVGSDERLVLVGEHCPPLGDRRPVIVTGESGVGKTRLLAETAQRAAERDVHVCYLAPASTGTDAAFGPVVAAMPWLADAVRSVLDSAVDHETRRARLWATAAHALEREAAGRAVLLLVDDCQWLDSYTLELVVHLGATTSLDLTVVAAGRRDEIGDDTWLELRRVFARLGAVEVEIRPLGVVEIRDLVRDRRPDLGELQVASIADAVFSASAGVPGVATLVIDALADDPFLQAVPDRIDQGRFALDAVIGRLPTDVREIGVVASVIGPEFDLPTLATIARVSQDSALAALDPLISRRLVVERTAVEFTLAHVLVQAAFTGSASRARVAELHRRAAAHWADDLHRHARHLAASSPLGGSELAGRALVRSAFEHLATGRPREASTDFAEAQRLGEPLSPGELAAHARALDLVGSGRSAAELRDRAVGDALAKGDHTLALHCAVSGLPEAEPIDGDPRIVAHLLRLDPSRTDREDRWLLSLHLARQLAIVGRTEEAADHAAGAVALAATALERVRAGLVRRFVMSATSPPGDRLALLAELRRDLDDAGPALRAEFLVLTAIDSYEALDVEAAVRAVDELDALGPALPSIRGWHSMMLRAMFATDAGEAAAADVWRRRALEAAQASGAREGYSAFVGASFVDAWRDGTLLALLQATGRPAGPAGPPGEPAPERTALQLAAAAVVAEALGDGAAAQRQASDLAAMVLQAPVAQGTSALAMVSPILSRGAPELAVRVREILARRGAAMIVVGAGAASLGPAPRYVAMLTRDHAERRALLLEGHRVAVTCGATVWQAVLERDLRSIGADPSG